MKLPFFSFLSRLSAIILFTPPISNADEGPYQATGFKVGEVSHDSALVWTRLTEHKEPNPGDGPWFEIETTKGVILADENNYKRVPVTGVRFLPPAESAGDLRWAVPGATGATRVGYRKFGKKGLMEFTEWVDVDPKWDYTVQHELTNLIPGVKYELQVESRGEDQEAGETTSGSFVTAPGPETSDIEVEFAVSTGQAFKDRNSEDGFVIYDSLLENHPGLDFFVHTGDIVYYDRLAKTTDLANYHWQRTYGLPTNVRFHKQVASYFIKDDHDTLTNDCWPTMKAPEMGEFTFEQGLDIFVHQVPMHGRKTYRTQRWGKDLQVWMVEGRDFRSANTDPDGPEKTIWGEEQKAWFKETFAGSDATFRVLISPTPIVGPDRAKGKNDNHSNQVFSHEGDEIREFLSGQKNAFVVCGDRHWQYYSVHPETGIHEFSCGPASDKHAGGWKKDDFVKEMHRFLRVKGGYLTVLVKRTDGEEGGPKIVFRHHSEDGEVKNEVEFQP